MRNKWASLITIFRMVGAVALLATEPLSAPFYVLYALCGASDIADGIVARATKTESRLGAALDSIADLIFIAVMLAVLLPVLAWQAWMLWWIGAIAAVRGLSVAVGWARYRTIAFLHTYANKATGLALFCVPFLLSVISFSAAIWIVCGLASLSALEELAMMSTSSQLNRDVAGIFARGPCKREGKKL